MSNFTEQEKAERLWYVLLGNVNAVKKQAKELKNLIDNNPELVEKLNTEQSAQLKLELDDVHQILFAPKQGDILVPVGEN